MGWSKQGETDMLGKRINLFKLLGFQVRIDLSWIIIAILVTWSLSTGFFPFHYRGLSAQAYWVMGIVGALGLFFSIVVHEFCHSLMAKRFDLPMNGITLFIFGGMAEMSDEPKSAKAEFMVAIVGPLSSLAVAAIFYAIHFGGRGADILPRSVGGVIQYLAFINVVLAAFNCLPAFPLDGGRVLRSILWGAKGDLRWATRVSSSIGSGFGVFLIIMGVYNLFTGNFIGGMWWALIGMFLHSAAKMSYQQLLTRSALLGESVSRFMRKDPVTVPPGLTLDALVEDYIYRHHYKMFPVVTDYDMVAGCVTTKQVKEVPREEWKVKKVAEIVVPCSSENTVPPETDAVKALSIMHRTGSSRLMVVDGDRLAGIVSLKDMLKFLSLKIELGEKEG
jgi:Zn-dependent protease/CBS domain-containing protein